MNCLVAEKNGSLLPQSTRIGIDASAGRPNTVFADQSSALSNAPGAVAPYDIHNAGLTAVIAAVRPAPSRPPSSSAP